jgi:lipoyl synthase
MVGLGETFEEVISLMKDLRQVECDILTIGQYLRPSPLHLEIAAFIPPEVFNEYKEMGEKLGFKYVASAPWSGALIMRKTFSQHGLSFGCLSCGKGYGSSLHRLHL